MARRRPKWRTCVLAAGCAVLTLVPVLVVGTDAMAAPATGATSTTIPVGFPYIDLSTLQAVGSASIREATRTRSMRSSPI